MRILLFGIFLLIAACYDGRTQRVCVRSTAAKEEAIACGTARYPGQCWEWVRKALCTQWRTDYVKVETGFFGYQRLITEPCRTARAKRREVCLRSGWKEGTE